jgi:integrase
MEASTIATESPASTNATLIKRRKRDSALRVVAESMPDGTLRWKIAGLYVNGKRKREFFTTEEAAKHRLQSLRIQRENLGTRAANITGGLAEDAVRAAQALTPFGVNLLEAVREYVKCRELIDGTGKGLMALAKEHAAREAARRRSLTLVALKARFFADPETKKRSKFYLDDLGKRWRRFEEHFGAETLATDIKPEAIREWLHALPVADITKGNFHRNIAPVFAFAVHAGLIAENPFRKVRKPTVAGADGVAVFTPGQMRGLLRAADAEWLPVLALGGFAGLRPEEIRRLSWEDIDTDSGFIEVKASKSKTGQRRLVTISPTLRAWLRPYADREGGIVPKQERKLRLAAMKLAKVETWPVDVLRHSFASYHLAAHGSIDGTALELGHQSTKMLFKHYREAVKPEAAKAWWALLPPGADTKGGKILRLKPAKRGAA